MYKVKPTILTYNQTFDLRLDDITVVTIKNLSSGYEWRYSFGEGFDTLKDGETITFEAGANSVFAQGVLLSMEPIEPETKADTDFAHVNVMCNKLTELSQIMASFHS